MKLPELDALLDLHGLMRVGRAAYLLGVDRHTLDTVGLSHLRVVRVPVNDRQVRAVQRVDVEQLMQRMGSKP